MGPVALPITLMTAGGAALINLWLAIRTTGVRRAAHVSIGDGGNERLICRMRAQANFVEYAPFVLILIAVVEFSAGTSLWLWAVAALFLLARVAHPLGMDGMRYGRIIGTVVTLTVMGSLGIYAIMLPYLPASPAHPATTVQSPLPRG